MRLRLFVLGFSLSFSLISHAQFGPPGGGGGRGGMGGPPRMPFAGKMTQLFGENPAFTATMMAEMKSQRGTISVPAKIAVAQDKSRFEMDTTQTKGANMPAGVAEQMKAMGMGELVTISRPDKKESYLVYPGLKAYAVMPLTNAESSAGSKADVKKTELGKETVDGHPTTKYKMVMKDADGKEQEATLWSASDLNGFPVKIEMNTEMGPTTTTFSDVKLNKPDESVFEPPAGFQRYNDVGAMMRETMMKRFAPPGGAFPAPNK